MEECTISSGSIHYAGTKIATYKFLEGYDDIPVFEFIETGADWLANCAKVWKANQKEKFLEAVSDCQPPKETVQQKIIRDIKGMHAVYDPNSEWGKSRREAFDLILERLEKKTYESL